MCLSALQHLCVILPYPASSCLLLPPPPACPFNGSDSEGGVFTYLCFFAPILTVHYIQIRTRWHEYKVWEWYNQKSVLEGRSIKNNSQEL